LGTAAVLTALYLPIHDVHGVLLCFNSY
jgi:hypothetical protein